ncbi:hypothetical protein D9615_008172 [Tricholomella constricta]|uniref:F-box domain-containing protein n=1 Tax=Tricholomella constricta TaxID=117010 RepID=A0A8H5H334_9AGAR|nr:hypothetical protein D9615_008172 [Tricholomella constricta]
MSFLHRRRSLAPAQHPASEASLSPIPFPPAVENISSPQSPTPAAVVNGSRTSGPGNIIRRVSTIFSSRKKRQPATPVAPLDVQAPLGSRWMVTTDETSPTESEASLDEIRRPSGLGRAVSISSNRSLPPSPFTAIDEESPFHMATNAGHERIRAMSSPNLLRASGIKSKALARSSSAARLKQDRPPSTPRIPTEVLVVILSFLPRHVVSSLAIISRDFCSAARFVFYETLDLRTLRPKQVEGLVTLLAYRHDLTDLVRTFECHIWPTFFPPQSNCNGVYTNPPSFSPALTATFTVAFQNMHRITSLVLPSFDHTFLRHHSAFGLKKLTFLNHALTNAETIQLFAWLDGQTNITHLAFPNLLDPINTPSNTLNTSRTDTSKSLHSPNGTLTDSLNTHGVLTPNVTPSGSPTSTFIFLPPATPKSPFNSPALLPALTTLVATPSIITSLLTTGHSVPPRPLQHVTFSINNTLYTGLRPAALLNTLHGITTLVLKFGPTVDKRTIGKVISAGAALSHPTTDPKNTTGRCQLLQALEIELPTSSAGIDQALYKIITSALSRYHGLIQLRTRFKVDASREAIDSARPTTLSDPERAHVTTWAKHCPSLQFVQLLSGARWTRSD